MITGPSTWKDVDPLCDGIKQSPINIITKKVKRSNSLTSFKFSGYKEAFGSMLMNTGQTGKSGYLYATVFFKTMNK